MDKNIKGGSFTMKRNKLIAILSILALCINILLIVPITSNVVATDLNTDNSTAVVENCIYRTTIDTVNNSISYKTNILAYDNGHIVIESNCVNYTGSSPHLYLLNFSNISFNDTYIADIDTEGYANKSNINIDSYTRYTTSFVNENIVYTFANTNGWVTDYLGKTLYTMNLYVKEPYLYTEQTISVNDEPIVLPFNNIQSKQETSIEKRLKELEEENRSLKEENIKLKSIIDTDNILRLDTNNDSIIDASDASTILRIYAINSTGGNIKTFNDLQIYDIEHSENEINTEVAIEPTTIIEEDDFGDLNNNNNNNLVFVPGT